MEDYGASVCNIEIVLCPSAGSEKEVRRGDFVDFNEFGNTRQGPRLTYKSKWVGEPD